jgi:hypothetical protein
MKGLLERQKLVELKSIEKSRKSDLNQNFSFE